MILSVLIVNSCEGKGIEKRNLVEKNDENGLQNGEGNWIISTISTQKFAYALNYLSLDESVNFKKDCNQ